MSERLRVHLELRYRDSTGIRVTLLTNQITVFQISRLNQHVNNS